MEPFIFKLPTKIIYGEGSALEAYKVCEGFGAKKILLVTDTMLAETEGFKSVERHLTAHGLECILYTRAVPEPPVEAVDEAADFLKASDAELVIAFGGGSSIDLSKAICMLKYNEGSARDYLFGGSKSVTNPSLPLVCIPTTAGSGSEVTGASVLSDEVRQIKLSITAEHIMPKVAIIDPMIQKSMPFKITTSTGMDALTHAIEAYVCTKATVFSDMYAATAITLIAKYLKVAAYEPDNMEARGYMAVASVLGAAAFVNSGLGAVHGISQAMGGIAHVPHGVANAMMLPYVMRPSIKGNMQKFKQIAILLGENIEGLSDEEAAYLAADYVEQLADELKIPKHLAEVGVTKEMFPAIIEGTLAYRMLSISPVVFNGEQIKDILEKAY